MGTIDLDIQDNILELDLGDLSYPHYNSSRIDIHISIEHVSCDHLEIKIRMIDLDFQCPVYPCCNWSWVGTGMSVLTKTSFEILRLIIGMVVLDPKFRRSIVHMEMGRSFAKECCHISLLDG